MYVWREIGKLGGGERRKEGEGGLRHIYKLKVAHCVLSGSQKVVLVDKTNEVIHIFCANNAIKQIVSYVPAKASGYF